VLGSGFAVALAAWIVWIAFGRARPAPAAR